MSETKHTPGPWRISVESSMIIENDIGQNIGSASSYPNSGYFPNENEAKANARLIAAAPELLDALETCLVLMDYGGTWTVEEQNTARAAIAKAKGEQP